MCDTSCISKECLTCFYHVAGQECRCEPDLRWYACPIHVLTEEEKLYKKLLDDEIAKEEFEVKLGLVKRGQKVYNRKPSFIRRVFYWFIRKQARKKVQTSELSSHK